MVPLSVDLTVGSGTALAAAAAAYAVLALAATLAARRRHATSHSRQPVSVLKPLHGMEPRLYQNLRSFCQQDYPDFQVLCGAYAADDPALDVVARLQREFPGRDIQSIVCGRLHGSNHKVSNLANIFVHARHEILVIADSDISVDTDYLHRVVAPLSDPETGLVTCLYRGRPVGGLWSRLGAMFIDEWFAPSVWLAHLFGSRNFAFGATIALRRQTLDAIGGFAAVADELADDYRLGQLTRHLGLRIILSDAVVTTDVVETRAQPLLHHELRWLRTIRAVRPAGYAFLFVAFGLPVAAIGAILADASLTTLAFLAATVAARLALHAVTIGRNRHRRQRHMIGVFTGILLLPVRDVVSLGVWVAGFFGRRVVWAGRKLTTDGHGLFRESAQ